ncbi:claret [Anaeramoeba flamelloides]|uniref:Claret n=1 Tax=Anaeramoeba flamelloides TaxID=1746091 RepID=A0ABQ8YR40_9EUKA|nr:claret [Anaeramoeba flamelloides]
MKQYFSYSFGYNASRQLGNTQTGTTVKVPTLMQNKFADIQLLAAGHNVTLIYNSQNQMVHLPSGKKFTIDEKVKQMSSGREHFVILTTCGKIYVLGGSQGFEPLQSKNLSEPERYKKLQNKFIRFIVCGRFSTHFITSGNQLYSVGANSKGVCGDGTTNKREEPFLVGENITHVFSGNSALHCFWIQNDKLYSCGSNGLGQLSQGNKQDYHAGKIVESLPIDVNEIQDIQCGYEHSLLLDKNGQLFSCGRIGSSAHSVNHMVFTLISSLTNMKIKHIQSGYSNSLAINTNNELYVFGYNGYSQLGLGDTNQRTKPEKVQTGHLKIDRDLHAITGVSTVFLFQKSIDILKEDFGELLKSKEFSDYTIHGIGCHKSLIELRSGISGEELRKIYETKYTQEQFNQFLLWAYCDIHPQNHQILVSDLGIENYQEKTLQKDLLLLYNEIEDSDFILCVKEGEDEDEDEDEDQELEEIPVHKLILIARCGLFRRLFLDVKVEQNKITDFSGRSVETLEWFIKFLYTDSIELTADDSIDELIEELEDAQKYYQLNEKTNLITRLNDWKSLYN